LILSSLENQNFLSLNLDQFFHAGHCREMRAAAPNECRFLPDYAVKPLATRIPPR